MRETTETNADGTSYVTWFDSPAEFAAAADAIETVKSCDKYWTGQTWDEALSSARCGRLDLVADAERLLEQLQVEVPALRSEWLPSLAGAYPVVPEALAGFPTCMRRKVTVPADKAPLRVFVDLVSSAGVGHEHLARRGVATLALAMALSNERAVELYVVVGEGNRQERRIAAVKLPSQPLDLATACNALTSTGFVRGLGYSWCCARPGRQGYYDWPFGAYPDGEAGRAKYVQQSKAALGADPQDVYLAPTFLTDPAATDPVGFVRRGIAEHGGGADEQD